MNVTAAPDSVAAIQSRIAALNTRLGVSPTPTSSSFAAALGAANSATAAGTPGQGLTGVGASPYLPMTPTSTLNANPLSSNVIPAAATTPGVTGTGGPSAAARAAATSSATNRGDQDVAQAAIAEAKKYLGTMYVWGGSTPKTGFDCSGLLQWAYKQAGVEIPRVTYDQVKAGRAVKVDKDSLEPGDLLFTNYSSRGPEHVLMYLGDGKAIEAPRTGKPVRIRDIDLDDVKAARRVTPEAPAAAGAAGGSGWVEHAPAAAKKYAPAINAAAKREDVPPALLASLIWSESNFNASARSGAGAIGLGQLMPGTARELGVNPYNATENINGAAKYLGQQLKKFGSVELAAAAYNAGPGAVARHGGVPPYSETRTYVERVTSRFELLSK